MRTISVSIDLSTLVPQNGGVHEQQRGEGGLEGCDMYAEVYMTSSNGAQPTMMDYKLAPHNRVVGQVCSRSIQFMSEPRI